MTIVCRELIIEFPSKGYKIIASSPGHYQLFQIAHEKNRRAWELGSYAERHEHVINNEHGCWKVYFFNSIVETLHILCIISLYSSQRMQASWAQPCVLVFDQDRLVDITAFDQSLLTTGSNG